MITLHCGPRDVEATALAGFPRQKDRAGGVLSGVTRAVPVAARQAAEAEHKRRLAAETAEAITAAGFARHFVPARWGGAEGGFSELLSATVELGQACASAAWCASLYAGHGRLAAYLPEPGQAELWERSPDVRISAGLFPPAGQAERVPGGWQLTGEWHWVSGVDHADWVLLSSLTGPADRPHQRVFAVPKAACTVLDTWDALGMRGTGSHTVVLNRVRVPEHRSFILGDPVSPRTAPGLARCHQVPLAMAGSLILAGSIVGAGRAALWHWTEAVSARPAGQSAIVQRTLADSSVELHTARLLLASAATRTDSAELTVEATALNQRDASAAAGMCGSAVDRLFRTAGTRIQTQNGPFQRSWRDVRTAMGHATLDPETAAARYASAVFGANPAN